MREGEIGMLSWRSVLLLTLSIIGWNPVAGEGLISARVDEVELRITVAGDDASRRQGLMGRQSMGQDEGVLLVYPSERVIRLWMLNTRLPLDVGFFDRDGVMVGGASMEPDGGMRIHESPQPALYALEMNRGWFERNSIRTGARLHLPFKLKGE